MNKKISFILLLLFSTIFLSAFAETIVFKSGKTIEGKIIEKTDKSIKVDIEGIPITYYFNDIEVIDGKKISISFSTETADKEEHSRVSPGENTSTNGVFDKRESPSSFKTEDKEKVGKNSDDDIWEMTIEGIQPMYTDSDQKRGESQRKMDEDTLKVAVQEEGSKEVVVSKIMRSAWSYFNGGYPNIAMRKFNQAWSLDPKNAEVYFGFGCILTNRNDVDNAIKMYTQAIDLNPKYYDAYANRGLAYANDEAYDKAILDFTKAIEIKPNEAQTYNDRAVACFFEKNYDKCWEDVNKAIQLGYQVNPQFLMELRKASGREK
ncbi:MAG: tetratricopeptide repeat protein [Candidatus Omnitrophota bacterium]